MAHCISSVCSLDPPGRKNRHRKSVLLRPCLEVFRESVTTMTNEMWSEDRVDKQEMEVEEVCFRVTKTSRISELRFQFSGNHVCP